MCISLNCNKIFDRNHLKKRRLYHHYKRFFKEFCTQKVKPNLTIKRQADPTTGKEKARK
jgi:hypothetical protein